MTDGYCLAYRRAWTHPVFKNLLEAAIWNFLYQNAFWEDGERTFNGTTFHLKRGQIVVSMRFLAKGFGISEKGARTVIQKLEKAHMLVKQGASKATIITICNYDTFQVLGRAKDAQTGKQGANRGRPTDANKNEGIKERRNERSITRAREIKKPDDVSEQVWNDFLKHRKAKKAPVTETVITRTRNEAKKINWTLEQAIIETCNRGWQGFTAQWIINERNRDEANRNNNQSDIGNRADAALDAAFYEMHGHYPDDAADHKPIENSS